MILQSREAMAESHSARVRAAGGATAAANQGNPTPTAAADAADSATRCVPNRWDRDAVTATAVEHERVR